MSRFAAHVRGDWGSSEGPTATSSRPQRARSITVALVTLASVFSLQPDLSLGRDLDPCERACGYALVSCLLDSQSGGPRRRTYRLCRRQVLGACRARGEGTCSQAPTTTTTTLSQVPTASLEGSWTLDLELLAVYGCTGPSTSVTLAVDISQSGDSLIGTVRGNGGRLAGYTGHVTNAGFGLSIHYTRRIGGRLCRADASIVATGFGDEIPVVVSSAARCGRSYCGGTFVGTMQPELSGGGVAP